MNQSIASHSADQGVATPAPGTFDDWFVTFNHGPTDSGLWIRHTLVRRPGGGAPSNSVWFARFDGRNPSRSFAHRQPQPSDSVVVHQQPFAIVMGESVVRGDGLRGGVDGGGHEVTWDLSFEPADRSMLMLPGLSYRHKRLFGQVVIDHEEHRFAGEPAVLGHVRGRHRPHSWAWGHAAEFAEDASAAIDVLSVSFAFGPVTLPRFTIASLKEGGEEVSLCMPWHLPLGSAHWRTGAFRFAASSAEVRVEGEFTAPAEDLFAAEYTDPDDRKVFCNNTEIGSLRLVIKRRTLLSLSLWREAARLFAAKRAHFEYAGPEPDPAITRQFATV